MRDISKDWCIQKAQEEGNCEIGAGSAEPSKWHWRNCRSIGLKFDFWLWPWTIGAHRFEDVYGGERGVSIGPFCFGIAYSIGNASSYGLDRFTARAIIP